MTSEAQNSLVAFRPLPLPSEVKTSTFSIFPIVISQAFRQRGRYLTLSQVSCPCCYFSTFSIPKSKPINGQATSPSPPPLATGPSPPPLPLFLEAGRGQARGQWCGKGLTHHPAKRTERKMTMGSCGWGIGSENLESSFARGISGLMAVVLSFSWNREHLFRKVFLASRCLCQSKADSWKGPGEGAMPPSRGPFISQAHTFSSEVAPCPHAFQKAKGEWQTPSHPFGIHITVLVRLQGHLSSPTFLGFPTAPPPGHRGLEIT